MANQNTRQQDRISSGRQPRKRAIRRRMLAYLALAVIIPLLAVVAAPWMEEAPLREAEALLESGEPGKALRLVDGFLSEHRGHEAALALKARGLVAVQRPGQALSLLLQVGMASDKDLKAYTDACLMLERWTDALPVLEVREKQSPQDADLLHELSGCLAKLSQYDRAVEVAKRFTLLPDCESRGYTLQGMLERDRGNSQRCCEAWAEVLKRNPEATDLQITPREFFLEYGRSLLQISDYPAAVEALARSAEMETTPETNSLYGKALMLCGRAEEAEARWKLALVKTPDARLAAEGMAEILMSRGQFEEALGVLRPLSESELLRSSTSFLLQRVTGLLKRPEEAEQWKERTELLRLREESRVSMEQVVIFSPGSLWANVFQAYFLAEQDNLLQATALLKPCVKEESHEFIHALWDAVEKDQPLPPIETAPLEKN
jgi:Flp pilus assembly protein TadD